MTNRVYYIIRVVFVRLLFLIMGHLCCAHHVHIYAKDNVFVYALPTELGRWCASQRVGGCVTGDDNKGIVFIFSEFSNYDERCQLYR